MVLAVKDSESAPEELVFPVIEAVLLLNLPEAPLTGAVKVTLTPEIGLPKLSVIVTASALVKAVLTTALCGVVPALAVMELAAAGLTTTSLEVAVNPPAVVLKERFMVSALS